MDKRVDNVIRIPTSLDGIDSNFFRYWFIFLKPFHKLANRDIDVIACFAKHRFELSKVIQDADLLDRVTMSEDTKRKVREECKITLQHFQVIMSKLKKNKVIVDGKINPRYLPNINKEEDSVKLLLLFELKK